MKPKIALFLHQPKCSVQSGNGIMQSLSKYYDFKIFTKHRVEDDFFEEEDKKLPVFVDNDKRITKKFMTIYERVRLLGVRAKQLSLGAKPMIRNAENQDPKTIAKLELENKVMPLRPSVMFCVAIT